MAQIRMILLNLAGLPRDFRSSPSKKSGHAGATLRKSAYQDDGAVEQEPSPAQVSQDTPISLASNSRSGLKAGPSFSSPVERHTGHSLGAFSSAKKIFANSLPHSRHL